MTLESLPVVIIGAGPVGLAAAAQLLTRDRTPLLFEAGASAGAGMRQWGHVRMFSPWQFNVEPASVALLERQGWIRPDGETFPTGRDLVEQYLEPLAATPELAPHIRYDTRVQQVSRWHHDVMKDGSRAEAPFVVRVDGPAGEQDVLASAVIDASGTTTRPGVLGASGLPALGERTAADHIFYGIPDVLGAARGRYANRRVLVVGSGHSALNALLDLARLADEEPGTQVQWAIRRKAIGNLLGGARNDQLAERGKLGARVRRLLDEGRIVLTTRFHLARITVTDEGVIVADDARELAPVDEIIAATGFRPDWSLLSEVRLDLDPATESPRALAPLIDPNVHSCGTVRPHGAEELKHPDANVYAVGMKSYGRAPTFLLLTGYEQARSVVSAIAGDWDAARRVELVLPETGVCSTDFGAENTTACCAPAASAVVTSPRSARVLSVSGACCG